MWLAEMICEDIPESPWGYWISPEGRYVPVGPHQHDAVQRVEIKTFMAGWIRVLAVTPDFVERTSSKRRLFTAHYFSNFVTAPAIKALLRMVNELDDFDVYILEVLTDRTADDHKDRFSSTGAPSGKFIHAKNGEYADKRSFASAIRQTSAFEK